MKKEKKERRIVYVAYCVDLHTKSFFLKSFKEINTQLPNILLPLW